MKQFLIIGMGEFGTRIADKLTELKNEVCLVDTDGTKINMLKDNYDNVIEADCMQPQTLKELGVNRYDACIVTVGQNFQASLEITSRLKEFGARYVISKSYSDIQSKFLRMAGADEIVYPEKDVAERIAVTLNSDSLTDFVSISDNLGMYEVEAGEEWIGKNLVEIELRKKYGINVMAVNDGKGVIIPSPDYYFKKGDQLYLFGEKNAITKILKKIK